jgi:hypothetical protein
LLLLVVVAVAVAVVVVVVVVVVMVVAAVVVNKKTLSTLGNTTQHNIQTFRLQLISKSYMLKKRQHRSMIAYNLPSSFWIL